MMVMVLVHGLNDGFDGGDGCWSMVLMMVSMMVLVLVAGGAGGFGR